MRRPTLSYLGTQTFARLWFVLVFGDWRFLGGAATFFQCLSTEPKYEYYSQFYGKPPNAPCRLLSHNGLPEEQARGIDEEVMQRILVCPIGRQN